VLYSWLNIDLAVSIFVPDAGKKRATRDCNSDPDVEKVQEFALTAGKQMLPGYVAFYRLRVILAN
jgi:hypothetical protein